VWPQDKLLAAAFGPFVNGKLAAAGKARPRQAGQPLDCDVCLRVHRPWPPALAPGLRPRLPPPFSHLARLLLPLSLLSPIRGGPPSTAWPACGVTASGRPPSGRSCPWVRPTAVSRVTATMHEYRVCQPLPFSFFV
jgi:hypothetical protein